MIKELILASGNKGKISEFQTLLEELQIEVHSMKEYPEIGKIVEDGNSFQENALIKARTVCKATGKPALADDSGIMVDTLGGKPGIYSARYAGEPCDDRANNEKLLAEMADVPEEARGAQFYCAIALVMPDGREALAEGICRGTILRELRGDGGFGYDPLFYVPELEKSFAELNMEEKNQISHRGKANRKAVQILREWSRQ